MSKKAPFNQGVMHISSERSRHAEKVKRSNRMQAAVSINNKVKQVKQEKSKSLMDKIDGLMHGRPPRFALVRTLGGLGDALMVTPTFKALKEKYPGCHITYGTTKEYSGGVLFDILENNPYIDELVPYQQIDKANFDLYADLTSIGVKDEFVLDKPKDRQAIWANYVGVNLDDGKCIYVVEEDEKKWAKDWLDDHKKNRGTRFVFIQPGSFADRRNWPREKMIELMQKMHKFDKSIVFLVHDFNVGEYKDKWSSLPNTVNISDFNIRSIAAIMEQSDLVIAHDSGMLHLAGALDCKIVSIFGSTHPMSRINWFKNCIAVWQKNLACAPCWYKACGNHYYCMKALDVQDVYGASLYMLDKWDSEKARGISKLVNVDYFYGSSQAKAMTLSDAVNFHETFPVRQLSSKKLKSSCKLSILMVTMDNYEYLKNTIDDVFKYTEDFELLIYQNARNNSSKVSKYLDKLVSDNKNVKLIKDKSNAGFLEPNNLLATKAKGKYICLLNDDMSLCEDWAKTMTSALESNETLAQVGVDNTCTAISHDGCGTHGSITEYIEGSCMVMPRKVYDRYGLFDEKNLHFAYHEDSDLSLRLREHGWNVATIDVSVVHHREKTSSRIREDLKGYQAKNKSYFLDRWKHYLENRNFNYKIGIQRLGAIGDVLLITPIIEGIKNKYPLSNITVITKCPEALVGNEHIHKCTMSGSRNKYDMFYNLDDSYENIQNIHVLDAYADSCGLDRKDIGDINFSVDSYNINTDEDYVVMHTGPTAWAGRNWRQDRFDKLAKKIKALGYKVVLIGTGGTPEITCDTDLRGKTNFAQTGSVIKGAKCFVGIDSSPFHIAQSQKTPSVIFFGCINPEHRIVNDNVIGVNAKDLACIGCHHWKSGDKRATPTCVREDGERCIEDVTVDMMYEKVLETLHE